MAKESKAPSVEQPNARPTQGKFGRLMNVVSFGYWNKLTPRERAVWCTSWNISSWVTIGQISGGAWLWSKVTAAAPWLVPAVKSVWTQVLAVCTAAKHAFDVVS